MHHEAFHFIRLQRNREWARLAQIQRPLVVDLGGANVNGTPRPLFEHATMPGLEYIAVDQVDGPGVDVVTPAECYDPPRPADIVVCAEALEHAPGVVEAIVANAYRMLAPNGLLIVTAAAPPRAPHGCSGGPLPCDEAYANVTLGQLTQAFIAAAARCPATELAVEHDRSHGDVRGVIRKGSS